MQTQTIVALSNATCSTVKQLQADAFGLNKNRQSTNSSESDGMDISAGTVTGFCENEMRSTGVVLFQR